MTKIYLIRHGEAEGNLYRLWQGQWDGRITPMGYKQIDALAERFRDIPIDALYSSDLRRASTTAGAITKYHQLKLNTTPRLREINCGPWEGLPFGNVERDFPVEMGYFNNDPDKWLVAGAETFIQCRQRVFSALTDIARENDGKTVAVVSHGMAIRTVLAHILGISSENIRTLPHGDNTSVALLNYDDGKFSVEYYNDNSHLPVEISTFAKQTWWREDNKADRFNLRDEPMNVKKESKLYSQCYADSWRAAHGSETGFVAAPYLSSAASHSAADPRAVLKIYSGEDFAGVLDLDPLRGAHARYGWITLLYLRPEFRGHGLASQLLGRAVCYYEERGMRSLRLHVASDNKNALEFYRKSGFEAINVESGMISDLLLMEKSLV